MKRIIGLLLCTLLCFQAVLAQIESAGTPTPYLQHQQTYHRKATSFFYTLQVDTTQALPQYNRLYTVGQVVPVQFHTDTDGIWTTNNNGTKIWRMGLVSKGAASMSVVLNQVNIPQGAKIFVYNPAQTRILGAFGAENNNQQGILPIRPLIGDSLIVEYQEPDTCSFSGSFGIERVAHNRKTNTFNSSNTCSQHANHNSQFPLQKQAVCLLYVVSTSGSFYGTGCLINNEAGKPYVYTAAHTFPNATDATYSVFYFNYAVTEQNSNIQGTQECSVSGGTMRAYAVGLDLALVELNQMPPKDYRPYLAGWSRSKTPPAPLTCIQHHNGDSKKMSFDNNAPVISNYGGTFPNQISKGWWYISRWDDGITEAGSSGSPLFDNNGLIIGALSGGSSFCNSPISDYFARLDTAWTHHSNINQQLAHWLSPSNSELTQMSGADPYADQNCQRIKHISKEQTINATQHSGGYYAGHNSLNHTAFAEKFTHSNSGLLYGAYIMPYKGSYNANAPVYLTVYSGTDKPETLLGKALIRPRDITYTPSNGWGTATKKTWSNKENYIRFSTPIEVPSTFFVGVEIQYNVSNTFALYHAQQPQNQAYYFDGNQWKPYSEHSISPTQLSLWIEPVHCTLGQTSVAKITEQQAYVYPNPTATGMVSWQVADAQSYKLYDIQGNLIQQGTQTQLWIDLPGIYLLQLFRDKQPISVHKVIRY